jgi:hypothetical protein
MKKNERVAWMCFAACAVAIQYFYFIDYQALSSVRQEQKIDAKVVEQDENTMNLQELLSVFDESPELNPMPDEAYSRGYTDGYHRATEQMQCPSTTR